MTKSILKTSKNPITLQCTCKSRSDLSEFMRLLNLLSYYGFYGIELNLPDLDILPFRDLSSMLHSYGLTLTYLATGAYAMSHNLSLSCADPVIRRKSIEGCMDNIRYAAEFRCGIIIGYLKNNPQTDLWEPSLYLEDSLARLDEFAQQHQVPILLEATNRYESRVANSLEETMKILSRVNGPMLSLLPDTYHMNIEENRPLEMLSVYQSSFRNLHLSDNNRHYPGLGCISFENYLKKLRDIHYQGTLGIEGIIKNDPEKDLELCVNYLSRLDDLQ
ncbi:MAG: sugar phosphate isomerase/epimerase [Hungatella sp.]|nr:sugar phosphate isomerase/epimerase [Hungatella sp.]